VTPPTFRTGVQFPSPPLLGGAMVLTGYKERDWNLLG